MAKEMMIVFVYDTLRCLAEVDDPAEAVLYFHPGWVSDAQRLALCGQLMGVCHCLKALLSPPRLLALQSGKFVVREYGRYILAVGSDRNIPDWMLKNRAEILTSLIRVYHCDLQTIAAHFPGENNPRFSEKLYQMFETYLPILQFGGYMFQTVPLLDLPKSATNIFLESMQVLDHCQGIKGVLGGTILYNNKIVATQLNPRLTSRLAMVDPYRIKSPAEIFKTDFDLPLGTQLLVIYIRKKYHETLKKDSERFRTWQESGHEKIKQQRNHQSKPKEPILSMMKRDKSLLFTAVPEEESNTTSPNTCTSPQDENPLKEKSRKDIPKPMPDVVPFNIKPRVRPNKLALSFKNTVARDSIDENTNEPPPPPIFTGQTSVCSTPMLEFKRLHGNVMSICRNSDDQLLAEALNIPVQDKVESSNPPFDVHLPVKVFQEAFNPDASISNSNGRMSKDFKVSGEHFISAPMESMRRFKSLSDINSGFKRISQLASMRFGKSAIPIKSLCLNSDDSPEDIDSLEKKCVTITDPQYPVFRNDGVPISISLFNSYLSQNYEDIKQEVTEKTTKCINMTDSNKIEEKNHLEGFDSDMAPSPRRRKSYDVIRNNDNLKYEGEGIRKTDAVRRKSLALPLKSLGTEKSQSKDADSIPHSSSLFDQPPSRKKLMGVQLTPLMEKLTHLAFSEKSSGYSSRGVTPMDFKDFALSTPIVEKTIIFPDITKSKTSKASISDTESDSDDDNLNPSYSIDSLRSVLYVFGLQNMSMIIVIDEEAAKNESVVQALYSACCKSLGSIEKMCMEPLPPGDESTEAYSYLSLDPQWGAVKRGGPWASSDVATMGYMHKDFKNDSTLTEIIIRSEDSLVFGTACGGAEVYYQETGGKLPGLPTPADLMGTAPLKAKRRLQRDHCITLF